MVSTVYLLGAALVLYAIFSPAKGLAVNIAKARKTGLPYIVVPVSPYNRIWQLTCGLWIPLIKLLPKRYWQNWLFALMPDWSYHEGQTPWDRLGETFLVVSPQLIIMQTEDAGVIHEITARREHFPKPTEFYDVLAMFGPSVVTTEGALWRLHRKATSASFNERNAALVFAEAIRQTQGMVAKWQQQAAGGGGGGDKTIRTLEHDTMTLTLNIIGSVGFGLRFLWPGQTLPADIDPKLKKYGSLEPPAGHSMTFPNSLATLLHRILIVLMLPKWMMKLLPSKAAKEAYEANDNYVRYMGEFLREKVDEVRKGNRGEAGMDIMGQLVRSKYGNEDKSGAAGQLLSDADIIGNAFIMIVAGHETTATTLHFALLELATNPAAQRALQADVDRLFGGADPASWNYERSVNPMLASMLGAAMNETLRLFPAVIQIPKKVSASADRELAVAGAKRVLPAGMSISLSAVSVHRNPRYWPTRPSRLTGAPTDLDDFAPERWFRTVGDGGGGGGGGGGGEEEETIEGADTEDYGGFRGPDTSAALFRPAGGSFVPFSEGARGCLGRRIAQVEMIAALAVIFRRHSLELAVDEWAADDEVARMPRGGAERAALYRRAQERSRAAVRRASMLLTLKLSGGEYVPVRLVPRGEERFVDFVE